MPGDPANGEFLAEQILLATQNDATACRIDVDHIAGGASTAGESLALADREELDAVMGAEVIALEVVKAARLEGLAAVAEEGLVILARHKADLLAVLLVGHLEPKLAGDAADLLLGEGAEREEGAGKLRLLERKEEVGLVLLGIQPLAQDGGSVRGVLHDRVVAGGDEGGSEGGGLVPEIAELQLLVAHDARVRSASGPVLVGEIIDHEPLEGNGLVDHIVGNPERMGDAAGIGDRLGAAAFVLGPGHAVLGPELHGDPDHVPALFLEKPCGHTGLNATAHPHDDASGFG